MRTCHPRCCSLLSTRSCWLTLVRTLSDVLDGFLLRLLGVSLWPCRRCSDFRCASCAPPHRLLLDHRVPLRVSRSSVLSVASSVTVSCVAILLRSHGLSIPPKGTTPEIVRSGFFAAHVSSTVVWLMLSRHPSLCSLTSALICAVLHTSLEPPPADCTRECASCANRETTLCASRESSVHHCLSLKDVLSSCLRDSATAWAAEAVSHAPELCELVFIRGLL